MLKIFSNKIIHFVTIGFLGGIAITLFLQLNSKKQVNELRGNNKNLYQDYEISEKIDDILLNLSLVESAQRGYIITGEKSFLKDFERNEAEIKLELEELHTYLETHGMHDEFNLFKGYTEQKIDFANQVVRLFNEGRADLAMAEVESGKGARIMENILDLTTNINKKVKLGMDVIIAETEENVSNLSKWNFIGNLIAIIMALTAILMMYFDIRKRNKLQKKLNIALHDANKSLQFKKQFMSNMSHEIRTPMNAVMGFTGLLAKTKLDNEQKQYVQTIQSAGDNLLNIINDILDYSKIEAGMLTIEAISFSIPDVVKNVKQLLEHKTKEKGIHFNIIIENNIPENVIGDPTRLFQVLVNLTGNSIKFTSKGEITISVKLKEIEGEIAKVEFKVSDTGIGISESKLNAVFEEFNQGNSSVTREFGGTGLGLSIVRSLINLQNGNLVLQSELNKGTIVKFVLPYKLSPQNNKTLNTIQSSITSEEKLEHDNARILVVEDNTMNQMLMKSLLTSLNCYSDIADNGQEAINLLHKNDYELILMDLQMPILDGLSATKKIRNELKLKLPIIAMSANILPEEIKNCNEVGMNDYLAKPFKEIELIQILNKYLKEYKNINYSTQINEPTNNGLINLNYLNEMAKGKTHFIKEMLQLFISQSEIDVNHLLEAHKKDDLNKVKAIAHKLKTSVRFVGLFDAIGTDLEYLEYEIIDLNDIKTTLSINKINKICLQAREEAKNIIQNQ